MKKIVLVLSTICVFGIVSCGNNNVSGDQISSCGKSNPTIIWKNWDGSVLETDEGASCGLMPEYDGLTPTRDSDEQWTYTFKGWYPELSTIEGDAEYTAVFEQTLVKTKIVFDFNGGTPTGESLDFVYAESIDAKHFTFDIYKAGYDFVGWSYEGDKVFDQLGNQFNTPEIKECMTFKAEYVEYGRTPLLVNEGKYIKYGIYPQKRVVDQSLISSLDDLAKKASYTPNNNYTLDDVLYYRVTTKTTGNFADGTKIERGKTYWFEAESILWKVLKTNSGTYTLLSDKILDAHRFNDKHYGSNIQLSTDYQGESGECYANNYKYSEIRTWLNTDFYDNAFVFDNSKIVTSFVDNSPSTTESSTNKHACEDTYDKVYLLSYADFQNPEYGFESTTGESSTRYSQPTDFAIARGVFADSKGGYENNGYYWTRSPESLFWDYVWDVDYVGIRSFYVYQEDNGVRPAVSLSL